jgi:hypothetical protein
MGSLRKFYGGFFRFTGEPQAGTLPPSLRGNIPCSKEEIGILKQKKMY